MNKTPPPKLENISKAIKFTVSGPDQFDKCRLVATLNVGSACWFSDYEAKRHPEALAMMKEKLKLHLLWQLYHDQRREMGDALDEFMCSWTPMNGVVVYDAMQARDRLMALAKYSPPPGFGDNGDDDEQFCGRDSCACSCIEFFLKPTNSDQH